MQIQLEKNGQSDRDRRIAVGKRASYTGHHTIVTIDSISCEGPSRRYLTLADEGRNGRNLHAITTQGTYCCSGEEGGGEPAV